MTHDSCNFFSSLGLILLKYQARGTGLFGLLLVGKRSTLRFMAWTSLALYVLLFSVFTQDGLLLEHKIYY